jgi:hypothetical protein
MDFTINMEISIKEIIKIAPWENSCIIYILFASSGVEYAMIR